MHIHRHSAPTWFGSAAGGRDVAKGGGVEGAPAPPLGFSEGPLMESEPSLAKITSEANEIHRNPKNHHVRITRAL